jgi:hypothetical protein
MHKMICKFLTIIATAREMLVSSITTIRTSFLFLGWFARVSMSAPKEFR